MNAYYPFGQAIAALAYSESPDNRLKYNGKELQGFSLNGCSLDWYDYGARFYDPQIGRWHTLDPMADVPHSVSLTPFHYAANNPIRFIDPDGMDWVEKDFSWLQEILNLFGSNEQRKIVWEDGINSQDDLGKKSKDTWLGKNVVVATHNRDDEYNEPINTARFDVYLEDNKDGSTATFYGNTVAADVSDGGVLSPGLYTARSSHRSKAKYKNETALVIGEGGFLPSEKPNPRHKNKKVMNGIFLHEGNINKESLFDNSGKPYSTGCQTTGCGDKNATNGGATNHTIFKNAVGKNFNGYYYLRGKR